MVFSTDYWINAGGDDRRSDDDEPEPVGQLVTLEDLDEQVALEAGRKPMGRAAKIVTRYDFPPIPIRSFDWSAWVEGTEDMGMIIGRGPTEAAAIADLEQGVA